MANKRFPASGDRIWSLDDLAAYPDSPFLDQIIYYPYSLLGAPPVRLWIGTEAASPELEIESMRFAPKKGMDLKGWRWIDYGIRQLSVLEPNFGIMRFYGLTSAEARNSCLVITTRTELELSGDIHHVEELLWGLARKDAGTSMLTPSGILAGEPTVFSLCYRAGEKGLPPGSFLKCYTPNAFASPQVKNPDRDGAMKIVRSDAPVEYVLTRLGPESHEKHETVFALPEGLPPRGEVTLSYRSDDTYLYASEHADPDPLQWFVHYPPLHVAVCVDESRAFVHLARANAHRLNVLPGDSERMFLFLPGRRHAGAFLRLGGLVTDRFRNFLVRIPSMNFRLELFGTADIPLPASSIYTDKSTLVLALPPLAPGIYRARAVNREDGSILAVSNPMEILPEESPLSDIFWGEIHAHTEMSDGSGDFATMFRQARDGFALDFAAAPDHACYFSDNEWLWMQDVVNSFDRPDRFCALIAFEWGGKQGHRNFYTTRGRLTRYRGLSVATGDLGSVFPKFSGDPEMVAGPHTGHTGFFWERHDPEIERFMEIYSMWGNYEHLARELLIGGARIGFTGGGDCHEGRAGFSVECPGCQGRKPHTFASGLRYKCGITGAHMSGLSRKDLVSALRERHTYATTGDRILLDFSVSGIPMGDEGKTELPEIRASVRACSSIAAAELLRDGNVVHSFPVKGMDADLVWTDSAATPGSHFYYFRVTQDNGEIAWSSPVWITR